jgi:non-heme chloroperoxidase
MRCADTPGWLATRSGVWLRYAELGTGPPIVLVHGWKGSHRVWDRLSHALADRFRVVSFDLRGMGESDKPPTGYSFADLAGDLDDVLTALDLEDVTLVAWSMGCTVTFEYLRLGGERIGRLALVSGPVKLTRTDDFPWTLAPERIDMLLDQTERSWPAHEREFAQGYFVDPVPELVDWVVGIALQTPVHVATATLREQARLDFRSLLRTIAIPTIAVYGAHDRAYPPELPAYLERELPNGRGMVFEGSAHFPFLEEQDRFVRVLSAFASGSS